MKQKDIVTRLRDLLTQAPVPEPKARAKHRADAWCEGASVEISADKPFGSPGRYSYQGCRVCGWTLRRIANRSRIVGRLTAADVKAAGLSSPADALRAMGRRA